MTPDENRHIERALTDVRITVAEGFAAVNARLDATKDHEPRLRAVEQSLAHQLTREDVESMLASVIETARRPTWIGIAQLVGSIAAGSGIVLAIAKLAG